MISACAQNHAHRASDIWICIARAIRLKLLHHQATLPGYKKQSIFLWDNQWQDRNCFLPTSGKSVYRALLQPLFRRHFSWQTPLVNWSVTGRSDNSPSSSALCPRSGLPSTAPQGAGSGAQHSRGRGQGGPSKRAELQVTWDKCTFFPFSSAYQF